jgi:uncharacterized protein YdiU (UPF0061 family)
MLTFDNRLLRETPGDSDTRNFPRQVAGALWTEVTPTPVAAPRLVAYSREMAEVLGLSDDEIRSPEWVAALAGNALLPGMATYATCYGGHQFGSWARQLGDGRAIFLGEVVNAAGERFELQLKGAGPTPYSRTADGRAVLRSSLREFLCSEAMHHLGVPTTRALSLVATGESVVRDMFYDGHPVAEQGAVVCRVAPSFTRFGHFELPAARGDEALLSRLVDFTIARDFPDFAGLAGEERLARWFAEVCERTARLVADWMRVGFVHGVMNTDNMSILGLTIDYGPYGWVDNFDPAWTPNTTDANGRRYCFGRQPAIARWNLERLADALALIAPDPQALGVGIERYDETYDEAFRSVYAAKFGFAAWRDGDAELLEAAFELMQQAEVDMTIFFRALASVDLAAPALAPLADAFYRADLAERHAGDFADWLARWAERVRSDARAPAERAAAMNRVNPRYVLRNYLAQQAIDRAEAGDASMIEALLEVLRHPYDEQAEGSAFSGKRPDWARHKAGCSMLSCSS